MLACNPYARPFPLIPCALPQDYADQFPAITRVYDALLALPAVAAYFASQSK